MRNWILLVICLSLMVLAQSLWKTGLNRIGTIDVSTGLVPQIFKLVRSWQILVGISIFGITSLMWFDLLSRMELSLLYPMMSLAYVMAFFVGWIWLGESPNPMRLAGILVIGVGIFLVSRTGN